MLYAPNCPHSAEEGITDIRLEVSALAFSGDLLDEVNDPAPKFGLLDARERRVSDSPSDVARKSDK